MSLLIFLMYMAYIAMSLVIDIVAIHVNSHISLAVIMALIFNIKMVLKTANKSNTQLSY